MGSTLETVVFYFLAAFIIAMSIMTVTTQRIVRSAAQLLICCSCFSVRPAFISCWVTLSWVLSKLWFMPVVSSFFMYSPFC